MLDAEEYLHLAIHASQSNQHHAALEYLHKVLELTPDNAQAIFLLSAEYAELGLAKRAIEGMERCLSLDPNIEMANYQLGLLYLQEGRLNECKKCLGRLESSRDPVLRLFAQAMLMMDSDKPRAIKMLQEAANHQHGNQAFIASINAVLNIFSSSNLELENKNDKDSEENNSIYIDVYKKSLFSVDGKE